MSKEEIDILEAARGDEGEMIHYLETNQYSSEIPKETWNTRKLLIKLALTLLKQKPAAGEFTKEIRGDYDPDSMPRAYEDVCEDINDLCERLDRAESENGRLKKAIEDYGNNPAGFDWAVLEKIENLESINADLLGACKHFYSEFSDYGRICNPDSIDAWHHDQKYKEKILSQVEAAIAKAKQGGE